MNPVFVFDIDGTIQSFGGAIPKRTKDTLLKLTQHYLVILATGRTYEEAKPIAVKLGIKLLVCSGGKEVYDDQRCIYSHLSSVKELPEKFLMITPKGNYSNISHTLTRLLACVSDLFSSECSLHHFFAHFKNVQKVSGVDNYLLELPVYKVYGFSAAPKTYRAIFMNISRYEYEVKNEGINFLKRWLGIDGYWIGFGNSDNDALLFECMDEAYLVGHGSSDLRHHVNGTISFRRGIARVCAKYL